MGTPFDDPGPPGEGAQRVVGGPSVRSGPLDFSLTEKQRVNEPGQWALPVDGQSPCSKGSIRMGLLV